MKDPSDDNPRTPLNTLMQGKLVIHAAGREGRGRLREYDRLSEVKAQWLMLTKGFVNAIWTKPSVSNIMGLIAINAGVRIQ